MLSLQLHSCNSNILSLARHNIFRNSLVCFGVDGYLCFWLLHSSMYGGDGVVSFLVSHCVWCVARCYRCVRGGVSHHTDGLACVLRSPISFRCTTTIDKP